MTVLWGMFGAEFCTCDAPQLDGLAILEVDGEEVSWVYCTVCGYPPAYIPPTAKSDILRVIVSEYSEK